MPGSGLHLHMHDVDSSKPTKLYNVRLPNWGPVAQVKDFLESFGKLHACKLLPRGPGTAANLSVFCTYASPESTVTALKKLSDIKVSIRHAMAGVSLSSDWQACRSADGVLPPSCEELALTPP